MQNPNVVLDGHDCKAHVSISITDLFSFSLKECFP